MIFLRHFFLGRVPFAILAPGAALAFVATSTSAQGAAQSEVRQIMVIVADSVASRLRAVDRAHLYVSANVACDSLSVCNADFTKLVRETFTASAGATATLPGQRWPTLCDNSDEIYLNVPRFSLDSAYVTVVSAHAARRSSQLQAVAHSFVLLLSGTRWSVASYDTAAVTVEPWNTLDATRCAWSPEPGAATTVDGSTVAAARTGGGPSLTLNVEESCPWCRLTSAGRLRLGDPGDQEQPGQAAAVFSNGRGRYFVRNSVGRQLLVYDSTGRLSASVGVPGQRPGEFGSIDGVAVDLQDSIFVLDNSRRRIVVLTSELAHARDINLPFRVDEFFVLRDGRILTLRTPNADGDPLTIHRSTGEVLRSFGAPRNPDGSPCMNCGRPIATVAPTGYRIWLAWSAQYRVEEWDLSGRRVAVLSHPAITFGSGAHDSAEAGIRRMLLTADGSLWVGYNLLDPGVGVVRVLDVFDPVRARLVKSIVGGSIENVVSEGVRAVHRTDEFGFPELRLERFQLDRRR